jgi:hypothetical protein
MKKILISMLFLFGLFLSGCSLGVGDSPSPVACTMEAKICPDGSAVGRSGPNCEFSACPSGILYQNEQYGFSLSLPSSWNGYLVSTSTVDFGVKVLLGSPLWTGTGSYEDIPILVYPLSKWQEWEANNFSDYSTAAPIGPSERARNDRYVLATAPRYNYDYSLGWEEVEEIIKNIKTENISGK